MPTRRDEILDAAIWVLGEEGPRGLTHRAVDKALELPLGSTANLFGRRSDLLAAIVRRMEELDRALWHRIGGEDSPSDVRYLAQLLVHLVAGTAEEPMARTQRARLHLQLTLPGETAGANRMMVEELRGILAGIGARPERAPALLAAVDGLVLRAVTYGRDALPPQEELLPTLEAIMR